MNLHIVAYQAIESSYLFGVLWWSHDLIASLLEGRGFILVVQGHGPNIEFFGEEVALAYFMDNFALQSL